MDEFPLIIECRVIHTHEIGLHTQFIGEIADIKADEKILNQKNIPLMEKVAPFFMAAACVNTGHWAKPSEKDLKLEGNTKSKMTSKQQIEHLTREAIKLGATSSAIIFSKEIQVKDHLAALCNGEYSCPNYGLAASCPPYVKGPIEFRRWQAQSKYSITVKIELPTSVMFSDERRGVMQLLHQVVAAVEQKAVEIGLVESKAFAGGSCKELFCDDQETCCVVAENKPCRHIGMARPSMSAFGIDVTQLMRSSGWPAQKAEQSDLSGKDATSWVAGLIMLA